MAEKNYKVKRIYYLLLGIKESLIYKETTVPEKVAHQYNNLIDELEALLGDSLKTYKIDHAEHYGDRTYNPYSFLYQINPIITYLENLHINNSDYQINKIGYLYNSIEDKELHDRCGDILLGEGAYDRAINQATQILEDRIKKKAKLDKTTLIGIPLISKAVHAKIEQTILKFSDEADIQEGYAFIFKGIISVYRNPTHHSLNFKCNREYALKFCAYIDELLKEIDNCVVLEK